MIIKRDRFAFEVAEPAQLLTEWIPELGIVE
jgi:hypothetical protein